MGIEAAPGNELKGDLRDLKISGAKEIECNGKANKSVVVVFLPFKVFREVKRITGRLIRELEKKFQKKSVVIVANRTIMDKNFRRKGVAVRPRNRTLTEVHNSILEDVVQPTEIVGKRTRIAQDGSKLLRIFLDRKDKNICEDKLHIFSEVYKHITTKDAVFSFA